MNEQLTTLLETLSGKLGVATEVLWGALLRQAPISSITNIVVLVLLSVLVVFAVIWLSKQEVDECNPIWFLVFCASVATLIAFFTTVEKTIAGFINPEYWALSKILETL